MKIRFIFVGRLATEKWFRQILDATSLLVEQWIDNFQIDIFWSGELVPELLKHPLMETHLVYHGHLPKEQIVLLRKKAHYTLIPSLFLETFGLVGLDSISLGVPVLGSKKWWLIPFIFDEFTVSSAKNLTERMSRCIQNFDQQQRDVFSKKSLQISTSYQKNLRVDRFWQMSKNCKNCLLVSDYAVDIGGIESFLFQVKRLLETKNISTDLRWKTHRVRGIWRKIDLIAAGANIFGAFGLWKQLKHTSYELVRLHSVQRRIGRLPLLILSVFHKKTRRVMYHDMWLIHPFPSRVYEEWQLECAKSFSGYLAEWKNILWRKRYVGGCVLIYAKRLYSRLLGKILARLADKHFVPSAYMIPYFSVFLHQKHPVTERPHFISHTTDE